MNQNMNFANQKTIAETSGILRSPHGFSTRYGGISGGIYESMNLSAAFTDDPENVQENWRRFLCSCGIPGDRVVIGKQIHSAIVHVAGASDLRDPADLSDRIEADGYVTKEKGVPLAVTTADCVPVLLEDRVHGVIGAIHSGWRGTVQDINGEAIRKMTELGADPAEIRAAIGPAIDRCCFEVGEEVIRGIARLLSSDASGFYEKKTNGKYLLDLRGVVRARYLELGLLPEHIETIGGCTMCENRKYWSHRATNGIRGSMASVIMLR